MALTYGDSRPGPGASAAHADRSVAAAHRDNGQLNRPVILQAALSIVDRDGVDGLSMRASATHPVDV